ncbi:alpha-L-fucosidase [Bacteroides caccae]|mgnify:FL=1|jgi:alpha-L-fucosidase|uniref:alpha-L-fucosidase n=1 Tax=Bacteroides caccae TaxID=47678 RepID=UPI00321B675F
MSYFLKGYEKQYKKSPKEAALSWFQDVRFGLFVHWGPASLYGQGEWVMYNNRIPIKEYEQKAREFKGDKFNTQDYVNLALDANMKYITFVIKHHDGFAL